MRRSIVQIVLFAWSPFLFAFDVDLANLEARVTAEMDAIIDKTGQLSEQVLNEAQEIVSEGIRAHDRGDYKKAVAIYERALKKAPVWSLPYYEMAYSYGAAGNQEKALEAVLRAIALDPKQEQYLVMKGSILDDLGMADAAVASYQRIIELQPTSFLANLNLGITYTRQQKFDEAEKALLKAREIQPEHPSPLVHLANLASARQEFYVEEKYLEEFLKVGQNDNRLPAVKQRLDELRRVNVTLNLPPSGEADDPVFSVATGKSLSRALWLTKKHRERFPEAKRYAPSFDEEQDVLEVALSTWEKAKAEKPSLSDPTYDLAFAARQAGFLTEYIWYVNRDKLGEEAEKWLAANSQRVEEFRKWANSVRHLGPLPEPSRSQTERATVDYKDLFGLVMQTCDKSSLVYQIGAGERPEAESYFKREANRFRGQFKKLGTDCLSRKEAQNQLDLMTGGGSANVLTDIFRVFSPDDKEWTKATQMVSRLGSRFHDFAPPPAGSIGSVSKDGKKVQVKAVDMVWLPYLMAKAVWRYEPGFRERFSGPEDDRVSIAEEVFAWAVAIGANENRRNNSQGDNAETQAEKPDPYLTELESVARGDALAGFVLFEVLHRRYGVSLECLDAEHLHALRFYLTKFVFERISKQAGL